MGTYQSLEMLRWAASLRWSTRVWTSTQVKQSAAFGQLPTSHIYQQPVPKARHSFRPYWINVRGSAAFFPQGGFTSSLHLPPLFVNMCHQAAFHYIINRVPVILQTNKATSSLVTHFQVSKRNELFPNTFPWFQILEMCPNFCSVPYWFQFGEMLSIIHPIAT